MQQCAGLRIAVEGCGHGTLNAIYASVEKACEERGWGAVNLLIIGGDFQAVRNGFDLTVMSCPAKFREIGDFHEYYSGSRKAPYLTIFVGGNHEASSHLWELYYGGWVAPNIYYMGAANVVRLGDVRIAGMSGIWKGYNYNKPHHERLPYNQDDIKSIYHVREIDIRKLLLLKSQVTIGISHDWPRAIEQYGDEKSLFRMKPDFEQESKDGTLGNRAASYVMDRLRPPYWFAAHMHCKFAATRVYEKPSVCEASISDIYQDETQERNLVGLAPANGISKFQSNSDEIDLEDEDSGKSVPISSLQTVPINQDEIGLDDDDNDEGHLPKTAESSVSESLRAQLPAAFSKPKKKLQPGQPGQPVPPEISNTVVRFLALDKCLPGRKFLQLLEIPMNSASHNSEEPDSLVREHVFEYDPEWLAITRVFASGLKVGDRTAHSPKDLGEEYYRPLIERERSWIQEHVVKPGKLIIPHNFTLTAPVHAQGMLEAVSEGPLEYNSPQTAAFCELIGIENVFFATEEERSARFAKGPEPVEPRRDGGFSKGRGRGNNRGGGFDRGNSGRGGRGARGRGRSRGRSRGW